MIGNEYVKKTVLRYQISLTEAFSTLIFVSVMRKNDESAAVQISALFETLWHVDCRTMFQNEAF